MKTYGKPDGFFDFIGGAPLEFKLFGGFIITVMLGIILFVIIRGFAIWLTNNAAENIQRKCWVVDKRMQVWGGSGDTSASTSYYITFEFEDKSRKELRVSTAYYGVIVVGDYGELTYQGTRFKEYVRSINGFEK